jgi:hypothetical protein
MKFLISWDAPRKRSIVEARQAWGTRTDQHWIAGRGCEASVSTPPSRRRARMPTSPYRSRKLSCLYFISGESR